MLKPTDQTGQVSTQDTEVTSSGQVGAMESANPEDIATRVFKSGWPEFKKLTADLTKNQLQRVLNALTEAPLNDKKFVFYDQKEIDSFNLGLRLMEAKFIMFQAVYNERLAAQIAAEQKEEKKEETNEAVVG